MVCAAKTEDRTAHIIENRQSSRFAEHHDGFPYASAFSVEKTKPAGKYLERYQ